MNDTIDTYPGDIDMELSESIVKYLLEQDLIEKVEYVKYMNDNTYIPKMKEDAK